MCSIYGFLNYGKKISHLKLDRILRELSIAAEIRGTDATGISYIHNGRIVTYKKALYVKKQELTLFGCSCKKYTYIVILEHQRSSTSFSRIGA